MLLVSMRTARETRSLTATYGIVGDDDTGVYSASANSVGFIAGGVVSATFGSGASSTLLDLPASSLTTGKALDISDLDALTTGIGVHLASAATAIATTGRLLYSNHTGATSTSGILNEFASAANDETVVVKITVSDVLATGNCLAISAVAMTTGKGIAMTNLDALTTGIGIHLASAATAITGAGRLIYSNHTGATGTTAILNEFASAANDETVICKVTASAALAAGKALAVSVVAMTTGTAIDVSNLDALTTGVGLNIASNSADATARFLAQLTNTNAAAVGCVPLKITNAAVQGTGSKFVPLVRGTEGTKVFTLWLSIDATTPNGNLSGIVGDICVNGPSGRSFYCTGTTNWTASNA